MLLKITLLKCFLINISTIQCFNVIMMKNLNENQLVNKLTEIANQGQNDNIVEKNVNSISVRSHRKRNLSDSSSEKDEKEENNENNDKAEVEIDKSFENVPKSNSVMKTHSKNENKNEDIKAESNVGLSKTIHKKPIKRTKKHKKNNHKSQPKSSEEEEEANPNIGRTIQTLWNTVHSWFRRNAGSRYGDNKPSLIDDKNLIEVMKRIIVIMRASTKPAKRPNNLYKELVLRYERSGEDNDPLAPGKLPINLFSLFTTTELPKTMWFKPNSFWNYWTYPKEIFPSHNCEGEGLVQHGNLCIDQVGH